ncbi:MAG TPA: hypothetical protein ENK09_03180 [Nitrospirae bacterium]|nr:hypothetical protein [Nitrospirota bacterium]
MKNKQVRQRYYISKELRFSIALMILWSFLAVGLLMLFTKEIGIDNENKLPAFIIVLGGYGIICFFLTMIFSHRLIGPFERLKLELRLIRRGNYGQRLNLRKKDDIYIRSFIDEVNHLIEDIERYHHFTEEVKKGIDEEFLRIISIYDTSNLSKEQQKDMLIEFYKNIKTRLEGPPPS